MLFDTLRVFQIVALILLPAFPIARMDSFIPSEAFKVIAQCDGQVFRGSYEHLSRPHKPLIQLVDADEFAGWQRNSVKVKKILSMVREAYDGCLKAGIAFKLDEYGGYCSYNASSRTIVKKTILPVIGILSKIPESMAADYEISVFRPTERCSFHKLMAGPARFVNHNCRPNGNYYAGFYKGKECIKIELVEDLQPGEELTVSYGDAFFGVGNQDCLCPHFDKHTASSSTSESLATKSTAIPLTLKWPARKRKTYASKPRGPGRKKKLGYTESTDTEQESSSSHESLIQPELQSVSMAFDLTINSSIIASVVNNGDELNSRDFFPSAPLITSTPQHLEISEDERSLQSQNHSLALSDDLVDWNNSFVVEDDVQINRSDGWSSQSSLELSVSEIDSDRDELKPLYRAGGQNVSVEGFTMAVNAIASANSLSDQAVGNILKLVSLVLPDDNACPKSKALKSALTRKTLECAYIHSF